MRSPMIIREKLRFPSGSATAQLIAVLHGTTVRKEGKQLADVTLIGGRPYVTLASAAGALETAISFDNATKQAALTSLA